MFRSSDVKTVPLIFIVDNEIFRGNNAAAPNKYTVELPSTYKDVISIELIQALITVPAGTDYVTLYVNNYSRTLGNATHLNSSFCTILNDYSVTDGANSKIIYKRPGSQPDESYIYYFSEPTKLSKINIEIRDSAGIVLAAARHILMFEIRSLAQARF